MQQDLIHQAENRGVGSDSESQCDNGDGGEEQVFAELAEGVAKVLREVLEKTPAPQIAARFPKQQSVTELFSRCELGFAHSGRTEFFRAKIAMQAHFFIELI